MSKEPVELSIVIITRNEEGMIGDSITSAINGAEFALKKGVIKSYEIIHADSASTDRTVEIAGKYPVKIIQLKPDWPLSAAAGLYTGYKHARGKYFMPLGGDMVLKKSWIVNAVSELVKDERLGAVTGFEEEHLAGDGYFQDAIRETLDKELKAGYVDQAGIAVFRMSVLKKVGGYNPYLKGGEDKDISYRIISAGYRILMLSETSIVHHWAKKSGEIKFVNMLRSAMVWSIGDGQSTRYGLYGRDLIKRQKKAYFRARQVFTMVIATGLLAIPGANIAALFMGMDFAIAVALTDLIIIIAIIYFSKRYNWSRKVIFGTLSNIPYYLVRTVGFVRGYMMKARDIESYPEDVKVMKKG